MVNLPVVVEKLVKELVDFGSASRGLPDGEADQKGTSNE